MRTYDPKKSDEEVSQANNRKMPFRVLIYSMIGGAILLALILLWYTAT